MKDSLAYTVWSGVVGLIVFIIVALGLILDAIVSGILFVADALCQLLIGTLDEKE